jgi:uncharacterized protein
VRGWRLPNSIQIPALPSLRIPPLTSAAGSARRTQRLRCTANRHPAQASTTAVAAVTGDDDHISDMIDQVLFTSPGERVNRPTFGSGLRQLVFAPNSGELAAATQFLVQGALQQWLGDLIQVDELQVESEDSTLRLAIQYAVRRTQQRQVAQFTREV